MRRSVTAIDSNASRIACDKRTLVLTVSSGFFAMPERTTRPQRMQGLPKVTKEPLCRLWSLYTLDDMTYKRPNKAYKTYLSETLKQNAAEDSRASTLRSIHRIARLASDYRGVYCDAVKRVMEFERKS